MTLFTCTHTHTLTQRTRKTHRRHTKHTHAYLSNVPYLHTIFSFRINFPTFPISFTFDIILHISQQESVIDSTISKLRKNKKNLITRVKQLE